MFDLFAADLMGNSPVCAFKARLLCLRSGRVAPRSLLYRKLSGPRASQSSPKSKWGAIAPHLFLLEFLILVLASAFELFKLAALPLHFQLVLVDLLVLLSRLILPALQLVADQSAGAQT